MNKSIIEKLNKLTGRRRSNTNEIMKLRHDIWADELFIDKKVSYIKLDKLLHSKLLKSRRSNIAEKWFNRVHVIKPDHVEAVEELHKGSSCLYKLPLWELLEDRPIGPKRLKKLVEQWIFEGRIPMWNLPEGQYGEPHLRLKFAVEDVESLFRRADIYGFIGILYLLRLSEAKKEGLTHFNLIGVAYRALAGLCRHPGFKKYWRVFYEAVNKLQSRVPTSLLLLEGLPDIIEAQIKASEHIYHMEDNHPPLLKYRYVEPEYPFREAGFCDCQK